MHWMFRRRDPIPEPRLPHARPMAIEPPFACSTCGRTDLPPAGDWDPPICEECGAAINFDALMEEIEEQD